MNKIKLEKVKIDNSVNYNYRDEDTLFFVNFQNLVVTIVCLSYLCAVLFSTLITDEGIQGSHVAIDTIVVKYLVYIFLMIYEIFAILNYRFLIKKNLKKFSWLSFIFIMLHSIFYIIISNVMLIGGPDLVNKMLT